MWAPKETGGILLGHHRGDRVLVTNEIGGGPGAIREPHSFIPDRDWQYEQIDAIYARAKGNIAYLGDWHTHPGGRPRPSRTDRTLLRRTANTPACQCPAPVMLILGDPGSSGVWVPAAVRWYEGEAGGKTAPLRLVN